MCADAWCIPSKVGSSSVPSPRRGSVRVGSSLARRTASTYGSSWTVRSSSSSATGAGTTGNRPEAARRSPSSPSSSARRMVRSTRTGFIGWLTPKSYSTRVLSKTVQAAPVTAAPRARRRSPALGQRPGAVPRRLERGEEGRTHLVVLELADGSRGRPAGGGHLFAQDGRVLAGLAQQLGGP